MAKCKSCGAEVIWATTEDGKKIPLDAKGEKRFIASEKQKGVVIMRTTFITHFATCPNADKHRKK